MLLFCRYHYFCFVYSWFVIPTNFLPSILFKLFYHHIHCSKVWSFRRYSFVWNNTTKLWLAQSANVMWRYGLHYCISCAIYSQVVYSAAFNCLPKSTKVRIDTLQPVIGINQQNNKSNTSEELSKYWSVLGNPRGSGGRLGIIFTPIKVLHNNVSKFGRGGWSDGKRPRR